jgi:bacterioferritin-associated ferredoxin
MTAKDEITLRTPDALLTGTSVVQVIQSCCPNIKDAWAMPSVDVDSTLIAIRIASYGQEMSVAAKCPKCNEEHEYDIDLQNALSQIQMPDYSQTITTPDGLLIKFKPLNYSQVSQAGSISFEEERLIRSLSDTEISEDIRKAEFDKHVSKMIELSNDSVTNCTLSITADGEEVTDRKFISEYYKNAGSSIIRQVQEKIKEFTDVVSIKPVDTLCSSCNHEFKLNIEFDYTRFFANGF